MRLISWNVNRAGRRVDKQVEVLLGLSADVIAIQEVSGGSIDRYKEGLKGEYPHFIGSSEHAKESGLGERKPCFVAIASRWELEKIPTGYAVRTAQHKFLSVVVRINGREVEIHTAHVPPGSESGIRKIRTLQGIYCALKGNSSRARILCGDFNCPRSEGLDGSIVTWGRKTPEEDGNVIPKEIWVAAEWNVLRGLEAYDLFDVWKPNGNDGDIGGGYSWQGRGKRRRYDHVLASMSLRPVRCEYLHEYLTPPNRLSDHAPIEVVFDGV